MASQVKQRMACTLQRMTQQGVSLIEMIVATGIILLLLIIALPVYSRFTQMRDQATCLSRLRQIGGAVISYSQDHRTLLPGPMPATQRASYTAHQISGAPVSLLHYIAPYLGLLPPPSRQMCAAFQCPAQEKLRRLEDDPVYFLHRQTVLVDGVAQRPFGYQANGATVSPPMRLTNVIRPQETVAIFDTTGLAEQLEIHSHSRNVLFIDGHVESIGPGRLSFDATNVFIR